MAMFSVITEKIALKTGTPYSKATIGIVQHCAAMSALAEFLL